MPRLPEADVADSSPIFTSIEDEEFLEFIRINENGSTKLTEFGVRLTPLPAAAPANPLIDMFGLTPPLSPLRPFLSAIVDRFVFEVDVEDSVIADSLLFVSEEDDEESDESDDVVVLLLLLLLLK